MSYLPENPVGGSKAVTLNDLEGHSPVAGLFKCLCAALYTISIDNVLPWFVCISRASCYIKCSMCPPGGAENAGVEKARVDSRKGKCRSGKSRSDNLWKAVRTENS